MITPLQQLRLLQLSSAALPIGGFTYSQGLEWAVECGWVSSVAQFRQWQQLQIEQTLIRQDLPLLLRLYRACQAQDVERFRHWSHFLLSCRETAELRSEEQQRGAAMTRVLTGLQLLPPENWRAALQLTQSGGLAWAGTVWQIPESALLLSLAYSSLESAVMAGVKLVPFGQQAAQSLLMELSETLAQQLPLALALDDEELGGSLPLVAIASSRHETQHTRLFRS
ncbi:urease accessory protein UreF [Pantoea sp. B65]|uniref:urease accessory protein UreF n=1 Tax=Pantoea sp. B65 TaxID=2813359 RepID=UPI0039B3F225